MSSEKQLRAVGYCRTSGEGQRDNTSIPEQRQGIESFCSRNGWQFLRHYVDESKTGSKIAGRDDFQQMLRDAANGGFDVVVVLDIDRFGRDGSDIIGSASTLGREFGVDVVDTKGKFDTRDKRRTLPNYVFAGVAENERIGIMERTMSGRIRRAKEGKPWSGDPPVGRAYNKDKGCWYVTDKGKAIADLIRRYLDGEGSTQLCGELLGVRPGKLCQWVHTGQLAGIYKAHFRCPELDIDVEIPVPGVPEVVSQEMLVRAKARLAFNRTNNRIDVRKYYLGGFLRCTCCGRTLTGRSPHRVSHTYYHGNRADGCLLGTVPGEGLEKSVLNHLYGAFLDRPAFDEAIRRALPSVEDRQALQQEITGVERRLAENQRKMDRLVDAIAEGFDRVPLLGKQDSIKAEGQTLTTRMAGLVSKLASLPDAEQVQQVAMVIRARLIQEHADRDWRKLPYEEVRRFLLHLFGETTLTSGTGIFVSKDGKGHLTVTFKGRVYFDHLIVEGRPYTMHYMQEADLINARLISSFEKANKKALQDRNAALADQEHQRAEAKALLAGGKPPAAYFSARKTHVRATLRLCSKSPPK